MRWPCERPLARRSMKHPCRSAATSSAVRDAQEAGADPVQRSEVVDVFARGQIAVQTRRHAAARRDARAPSRSRRGCRCRRCDALPLSGVSTPYNMRKVVDLPAPLAPRMPVISPSRATKETSRDRLDVAESLAQIRGLDHAAALLMAPDPSCSRKTARGDAAPGSPRRAFPALLRPETPPSVLVCSPLPPGRVLRRSISGADAAQVPLRRVLRPRAASPDRPRRTTAGWGRHYQGAVQVGIHRAARP